MLNIYLVLKIFCIIRKLIRNNNYKKKGKSPYIKEKVVQNGDFGKIFQNHQN